MSEILNKKILVEIDSETNEYKLIFPKATLIESKVFLSQDLSSDAKCVYVIYSLLSEVIGERNVPDEMIMYYSHIYDKKKFKKIEKELNAFFDKTKGE